MRLARATNALRVRLTLFLLALGAGIALVVGGATYVGVRNETDALFDYHLRQMALSLRDQGRIADEERAVLARPELDYLVQIWSADGNVLYTTASGPVLPPRAVLGFSNVEAAGTLWRVYSTATARGIVQVAQPLAARSRFAAAAAWRSVRPIVVAAPLVACVVWWVAGASLAPLTRLVRIARERDVHALEPLPLAGLPAEVEPLVEAFNALLSRVASAFDAQRSFVADAAHELRSPLTALKLQLELLRSAHGDAERAAALRALGAGIERANHLVAQLLTLARADPAAPVRREPLDLAELAREVLSELVPLAQARGAELALEAPAPVPLVGDATALRGLVRNLVDNAIQHAGGEAAARRGAQVAVEVRRLPDGRARLYVDDDGPGIPPAERERVFDRFYRRDPGRGAGSGLGLAIVRAIAERHGGSVALADAPAGGLRVEVLLPGGASTAAAATTQA